MQDTVSDEDRAKQLFKRLDDKCMDYEGYESWLSEELAVPEFVKTFAAIRADERERCAQIVELMADESTSGATYHWMHDQVAHEIRSHKD